MQGVKLVVMGIHGHPTYEGSRYMGDPKAEYVSDNLPRKYLNEEHDFRRGSWLMNGYRC